MMLLASPPTSNSAVDQSPSPSPTALPTPSLSPSASASTSARQQRRFSLPYEGRKSSKGENIGLGLDEMLDRVLGGGGHTSRLEQTVCQQQQQQQQPRPPVHATAGSADAARRGPPRVAPRGLPAGLRSRTAAGPFTADRYRIKNKIGTGTPAASLLACFSAL